MWTFLTAACSGKIKESHSCLQYPICQIQCFQRFRKALYSSCKRRISLSILAPSPLEVCCGGRVLDCCVHPQLQQHSKHTSWTHTCMYIDTHSTLFLFPRPSPTPRSGTRQVRELFNQAKVGRLMRSKQVAPVIAA
jgi:hypothetical protein